MDRMTFRAYVASLLFDKPQSVVDYTNNRIERILEITRKSSLSEETVGIIIMLAELENECRVTNI